MSQDSSLVQLTTSTGALHLARTVVGSAILFLWLFNCSTSSALNIKISAHPHVKMFQDLIFDRRTSRTAPLLPDIALHTLAPGDDDGITMIMMIMTVMLITIMMMEILQALAHQATPARQAANHFLGEASTMTQTPNQRSKCIYQSQHDQQYSSHYWLPPPSSSSSWRHLIQKARHCHKRVALNVGGVRWVLSTNNGSGDENSNEVVVSFWWLLWKRIQEKGMMVTLTNRQQGRQL